MSPSVFLPFSPHLSPRIPQNYRIAGSLSVILLVFLLTAVLVKVDMSPLTFFCLTMIKIICINCKWTPPKLLDSYLTYQAHTEKLTHLHTICYGVGLFKMGRKTGYAHPHFALLLV